MARNLSAKKQADVRRRKQRQAVVYVAHQAAFLASLRASREYRRLQGLTNSPEHALIERNRRIDAERSAAHYRFEGALTATNWHISDVPENWQWIDDVRHKAAAYDEAVEQQAGKRQLRLLLGRLHYADHQLQQTIAAG